MKAQDILTQAAAHMAKRAEQYDRPQGERSVPAVVEAFNAIKGREALSTADGWLFLTLLKLVRGQTARGDAVKDSVEDAVAYAALMGEQVLEDYQPHNVGEMPKPGPMVKVPMGVAPWPKRRYEQEIAEEQQKRNQAARDALAELERRGIAVATQQAPMFLKDPEPGSVHRADTGERIVTNTGQVLGERPASNFEPKYIKCAYGTQYRCPAGQRCECDPLGQH